MTTITYKKLLLPALLPAIILASCNREELDGNDTGSRTPAAFTAVVQSAALAQFTDTGGSSPATRTALDSDGSTAWTQGDAVSVFMLTTGGTLPDGIIPGGDNVLHNVDPASGALTPAGGTPIYYPQNTAEVDFIAWHNPTGQAPDGDYTLSLHAGDQATAGKQLALDPLYSDNARGISCSHHPVALRFRHLMSKVRFDITLGLRLTNGALTDVQLQGMNEEGSFDLRDGSVREVLTSGVPVAALKSAVASEGADATYTALIFPQDANSGNKTIAVTVNGKEYTGILPVTDAYEANTMYTYRVTVRETGVEVGIPTTDVPWTEGELPVVTLDNKTFRLIRNAADLKRFADDVNGGQWDLNALQTADIDLSGIDNWVPIGQSYTISDKAFTGIYNGNGYTISRLKINSVSSGSYMGLFGEIGSGALLTGIHLRYVEIIAKDQVAGYTGAIVGYVDKGATVSLCSAQGVVNVSLTKWGYVGGLAGTNCGVITRCRTDVTVTADETLRGQISAYVGGITGCNGEGGLLFACHATGSVTLKARHREVVQGNYLNAGGIAGSNEGTLASYANIYCCIAEGDVSVTSETEGLPVYAGGLASCLVNGNIRNCYARGNVTVVINGNTTRKEGAIVGSVSINNTNISYCYGAGPIGKGTSNLDADSDIVYDTSPGEDAIYRIITQGGLSGIPFTLYNAAATPAYGMAVTTSGSIQIADFWLSGDKTWPVLDFTRNAH